MKTLSEISSALSFRLGNRKRIETDVLREIRFAQERLEEDPTISFWFQHQKASLTVLAGTKTDSFPADFLRFTELGTVLITVNGLSTELKRDYPNDLQIQFGDCKGMPRFYSFNDDDTFSLYPTPDVDITISFEYVVRAPQLSNIDLIVDTNIWTENASQLLLNKAGIALAQGIGHDKALVNFTNDYQVAFSELITRQTQREEANFQRQRRGDEGDAIGNYHRELYSGRP